MGIEKDIHQRKFKSEYHKLRVNIIFSANWMNAIVRDFLAPYDITQKQFNILRILRGQPSDGPGLAIQEIRDRMIDKMSDTSRLVDRLISKGLIEKKPCEQDKRHNRVKISQQGLDLLSKIDIHMAELDANLHGLTESEASTLNDLLDKLRK